MPSDNDWLFLLFQAIEAVREDRASNWTELAEEVSCPRTTLAQGFRREFGISVFEQLHTYQPSEAIEGQTAGEKVEFAEGHNTASAASRSTRITTLEQLLEACQVDLNVWRVDHYVVNKWEMGAKTGPGGTLTVEPLFQVKAWLIRIKPEPLFPIIQPVVSSVTGCEFPKPVRDNTRRALILADLHFWFQRDLRTAALTPFHDRRALDVALQIAIAIQPDRIDMLGDLLDMTDWTDRFIRSPEFTLCTQPALLEFHWWLAQFRLACPEAQILVYEGNHGKRMRDAIVKHLPAAYDLRATDEIELPPALSLPKLLALHQLGIEWVGGYPDEESWLNDAVRLSHGDRARAPGNTTKAVVAEADVTEIVAHIHRVEWTSRTKFLRDGRQVIVSFCPGCLCHIDGRVPGKRGRQQWQNGVAVIDYEADGELYSIAPVVIDNGKAIWQGQVFEAQDRLAEIREGFPEWNWV